MQLFFDAHLQQLHQHITLETNTSKHLVQVLRMRVGQQIALTNGKGIAAVAEIVDADKRDCVVRVVECTTIPERPYKLVMAVCFTKNKARNEWMLEKMTELGVEVIIPVMAQRTEKEKFNFERLNTILESAMLQSKQYYLPTLYEPMTINEVIKYEITQKYIAHCEAEADKQPLLSTLVKAEDTMILIGPEGDFTTDEISKLLEHNVKAISLGANRLRTETAAMYACTIFNALNYV